MHVTRVSEIGAPLTLEQRKTALADAVRERRWQNETGGCVVDGEAIRIDE